MLVKWQPTPVFLPGESQGRGSLVYGVAQSGTRLKRLSSSTSSPCTRAKVRSREHALPERLPRSPFHTSDPGAAPSPDPAAVFEPQVTRCPRRVSPGVPQATKLGPERGVAPRLGTEAGLGSL